MDGLQDYFRETFSATSDFREVKKSPLLYGAVCAHMKAKPIEVLHIGDHYNYDYESALTRAWMRSFWTAKASARGARWWATCARQWS